MVLAYERHQARNNAIRKKAEWLVVREQIERLQRTGGLRNAEVTRGQANVNYIGLKRRLELFGDAYGFARAALERKETYNM
jgi:hypothetical protein